MNDAYIKANVLWSIIVMYKGTKVFEDTTLSDIPINGVDKKDVLYIKACSIDDMMHFLVVFKDDREAIRLPFKNRETVRRIEKFIDKRLQKITWNEVI